MAAMMGLEWGGGRVKKGKGFLTTDADLWRSDQPREGEEQRALWWQVHLAGQANAK